MVNRGLVVINIFLLPFFWSGGQQKDKWMDGQTYRWTNRQMDIQTEKRTD